MGAGERGSLSWGGCEMGGEYIRRFLEMERWGFKELEEEQSNTLLRRRALYVSFILRFIFILRSVLSWRFISFVLFSIKTCSFARLVSRCSYAQNFSTKTIFALKTERGCCGVCFFGEGGASVHRC